MNRCFANGIKQTLYAQYHDNEWGIPKYDDRLLFEMLVLEGAQAGLSWETILKKRQAYKEAFYNFDVKKVANIDNSKIIELLNNKNIIRNKLKINSAVKNANVFIAIQKEFGSFSNYLWKYVDNKPILNNWNTAKEVPIKSDLSEKISKDLKRRGMSFVGPIIMYSYMQAVGVINDHPKDCICYHKNIKSR